MVLTEVNGPRDAIEYLVQDVKDAKSKVWMKPAIMSHLLNSFGYDPHEIEEAVDEWFAET